MFPASSSILALLFLTLLHVAVCVSESGSVDYSTNFKEVFNSNTVTLVEFYSPMCGSCKEFAKTWHEVEKSEELSGIRFGLVNIDTNEGMDIAAKLGVLEEGLPNVQLFHTVGETSHSIVSDDSSTHKMIVNKVMNLLTTHQKQNDLYVKK